MWLWFIGLKTEVKTNAILVRHYTDRRCQNTSLRNTRYHDNDTWGFLLSNSLFYCSAFHWNEQYHFSFPVNVKFFKYSFFIISNGLILILITCDFFISIFLKKHPRWLHDPLIVLIAFLYRTTSPTNLWGTFQHSLPDRTNIIKFITSFFFQIFYVIFRYSSFSPSSCYSFVVC